MFQTTKRLPSARLQACPARRPFFLSITTLTPYGHPAMTDNAQQAPAQTQSSQAKSRSQAAPRKVRFNVGKWQACPARGRCRLNPFLKSQALSIRYSTLLEKVHMALYVLQSTVPAGERLLSRKSPPSIIRCFVYGRCGSSSC